MPLPRTLHLLLAGLLDDASLLGAANGGAGSARAAASAAESYARARVGGAGFAVGRLVCAADELEAFSVAGRALMPGTFATSGYREMAGPGMAEPWRLTAVVTGDATETLHDALDEVDGFNEHHAREDSGLARVDGLALALPESARFDSGFIDEAMDEIPEDLRPIFVLPESMLTRHDPRGVLAALAGDAAEGAAAAVPATAPVAALAAFIAAARNVGVPFVMTGLGRGDGVRGDGGRGGVSAVSAALAAALPRGTAAEVVAAVLGVAGLGVAGLGGAGLGESPWAGVFAEDHARAGGVRVEAAALAESRERGLLSVWSAGLEAELGAFSA